MALLEVSLKKLFPQNIDELTETFRGKLTLDEKGTFLDFDITDRPLPKRKISPVVRKARIEDAQAIVDIYLDIYKGTYPYKEMEDVKYIRGLIENHSYEILVYSELNGNIAGCITFVLDFAQKRGYIRGFMLKEAYQGKIDVTKAMIGSMLVISDIHRDNILSYYAENRTAHSKSQYAMSVCGISPIAFYPNKDVFNNEIESDLLQIVYNSKIFKKFRSDLTPSIIPPVKNCFEYSNNKHDLGQCKVVNATKKLGGNKLRKTKAKIQERITKDEYGYEEIEFKIRDTNSYFKFLYTPQVQNFEKTAYKVDNIEELKAFVDYFKNYEKKYGVRYSEVFVSAYLPEHQSIFYDAGYVPRGYVPCWKRDSSSEKLCDCVLFNKYEGKISEKIQLIDDATELLKYINLKNHSNKKVREEIKNMDFSTPYI